MFSRADKSVKLSPEVQALLGLTKDEATPGDVLRAILKAPVDLLWFGGIGTYVRSDDEADLEVGDRANDAIRINASDLRCKVVGEGANLGLTQRARVEAARRGVRLNTDAIDNSAGVNTSDLEVNIKIAVSGPLQSGALSLGDRDRLLERMTEDVTGLVLRNNYQQTLAISLAERRGTRDLGFAIRLMQGLESQGRLERAVEFLPSDDEVRARERSGLGLTRPEISVLLAYAKLALHDELLASDVPDDPYLSRELTRYFPAALQDEFPAEIAEHRLRREIVATQLANSVVNRGGATIVTRLADEARARPADVVRAFAVVRDVFSLSELNGSIDKLDGQISGSAQLALYERVQDVLIEKMAWFIRNVDLTDGIDSLVSRFKAAVETVQFGFSQGSSTGPSPVDEEASRIEAIGAGPDLARRLARLRASSSACDLVLVSEQSGRSILDCARVFFALDDLFGMSRLIDETRSLRSSDHFERLALDRTSESFEEILRRMTVAVLRAANGSADAALASWREARRPEIERVRDSLGTISQSGLSLAKSFVASGQLTDLAR